MANTIRTTYRTDNVVRFLADIRNFAPLSAEEENSLIAHYQRTGEQAAKDRVINAQMKGAFAIAKQFAKGDDVLELTSAATIGLATAIDTFESSRGVRFYSYAVHYMRMEILDYLKTDAQLVINKGLNRLGSKPNRASDKFFAENGRIPTEEELIAILDKEYGVTVESRAQLTTHKTASMDGVIDEDGTTVGEVGEIATATATVNEYESEMEREDNSFKVEKLLAKLPVRERIILEMAFGLGEYDREYEDDEIADKIGLTRERVRQLRTKTLAILKERAARVAM